MREPFWLFRTIDVAEGRGVQAKFRVLKLKNIQGKRPQFVLTRLGPPLLSNPAPIIDPWKTVTLLKSALSMGFIYTSAHLRSISSFSHHLQLRPSGHTLLLEMIRPSGFMIFMGLLWPYQRHLRATWWNTWTERLCLPGAVCQQ
jgi:hypothetical protein